MVIFNSSSINRDAGPRGIGVYPVQVVGTINIASNTTLSSSTTDTLRICYIPQNCFISDYHFGFPALDSGAALVMKLVDSLAAPTTYIATTSVGQAGGPLDMGDFAVADQAKLGTMYGATARSIGATGAAVVVWALNVQLRFQVTTTAGATSGASPVNITYVVEFSPMYDGGV